MREAGRNLPRNDPRQYDDLAGEWWRPDGAFAMLHWLAAARAALVPVASRPDALLVDLGCGAGLLAPHLAGKGYRHVGVDLTTSALHQAASHGVSVLNADATAVPLASGRADVVAAGELLEHVADWRRVVAEACRLLRPGGLLVLDTLNDTALSRLLAVRIAERLPTVPRGIHDPRMFVDARALVAECGRHGVQLRLRGARPQVTRVLGWLARRVRGAGGPVRRAPRIVPTWSTAVLYQGWGIRRG
ncbi:methyltransferase domain-containing protein [Micromonospora sp. WMMA1363]|uniref:methyltransferase domain-containing protein n=1 Tax=Micromonospora sp. WMMA1363 TaxID=3053985 RepID=UPI00259C7BC4|nr:methyltransferase domain-containing protein [Micromonospora sp. WMMA1363]MDM4721236.1 methyltransferase domain-containing protein [Micromonospora sp. WMMA1363]